MQITGAGTLARKEKPLTIGRIKHLVQQAERKSGTGATGFTLLKMLAKPIARLVDQRKIGPEELQAAADITTAFMAVSGALMIRPVTMERVDRAHTHSEPAAIIEAQVRYRRWAEHWSMMAKRGDRTLEVVIAAVIDERAFHIIEADLGLRHGKAQKATIRGLRDYAARVTDSNGKPLWVDRRTAAQWKAEAGTTFHAPHPELALAMARARATVRNGTSDS